MDLFTLGLLQKNLSGNKGDIKSKNGESSYTITDAVDFPVLGLNLYGKSVQDGVPAPKNPVDIVSVGDSGNIQVKSCGENILNPNPVGNAYYNDNGEIIESANFNMYDFIKIDGKTLTLTAKQIQDTEGLRYALFDKDKNFLNRSLFMNIEKTTIRNPNATYIRVFMSNVCYEDVRLAFGDVETIKPYCGTSATITSALPLCGIPVESGGNYTDNNGQQWICDELVYNADGTGKIVKKIGRIIFDGSEGWDKSGIETIDRYILRRISTITGARITSGLCNTYAVDVSETHNEELGKILLYPTYYDQISVNFAEYGTSTVETFKDYLKNNPIVLYTDLIEPQEIELTAAEMSALRQLMTYSGTTNISNNDNAEMDVKYCINQVMADYYPIFSGQGTDVQPLVLFQGTDEGYSLADGFTGFSQYSQGGADIAINKRIDATNESQYGYRIAKSWSINGENANYTDSVIISSNEPIDLTNHNTVCIDFYGYCDYSTSDMSDANDMAAYFRVDLPETLPQSKVAYDWSGWDNMGMNYRKRGKYYFDVSHLTGKHDLCFGIFHGTYDIGYTNGIKIYKITLI